MTREEAEQMLTEWAAVAGSRDERVRSAVAAGITKHRVHVLTGIGRATIDKIMTSPPPDSAAGPDGTP